MHGKSFVNKYPSFQHFVDMESAALKTLAIPERCHEKFWQALKIAHEAIALDNISEELLPWLTADMDYCEQYLPWLNADGLGLEYCEEPWIQKEKYAYRMAMVAVLSGKMESIQWLFNNVLTYFNEGEGETMERYLLTAMLRLKNLPLLREVLKQGLIQLDARSSMFFVAEDWPEGFVWFHCQNPQILLNQALVRESDLLNIFAVLRSYLITGIQCYFYDHGNLAPESCLPAQWMTGNLQFYHPEQKEKHAPDLILCGLRSGNMAVVNWLVQEKLIVPPAAAIVNWKDWSPVFPQVAVSEHRYDYFPIHFHNALIHAKNTTMLDWALANHLLDAAPRSIFPKIALLHWTEGFEWFIKVFGEELTGRWDNTAILNTPLINYLIIYNSLSLLELCIEKYPQIFQTSGGEALGMVAASYDDFQALRLFQAKLPALLEYEEQRTVLQNAALSGNRQFIPFAQSCNPELVNRKDWQGSGIAVYALNSLNPQFFNQTLQLCADPWIVEKIQPFHQRKKRTGYLSDTKKNDMGQVLDTLNTALETNYLLQSVSFYSPADVMGHEDIWAKICQKLDRNIIMHKIRKILIPFLACWKDEASAVFQLDPNVFLLICKTILFPEIPKGQPLHLGKHAFFISNQSVDTPSDGQFAAAASPGKSCQ